MNHTTPLPMCILEEIGYEGLEGITIEGLWKRVGCRLKLSFPLNSKLKNQIWAFVQNAKCLQLFELPVERELLKLFDRADSADPFFGVNEPETCPYNLYKYNPINTKEVRGSCEHFETRKLIDKETIADLTAEQIEERFGSYLVIVASQSLRTSLLIPPTVSREIDLNISCYCILERLARARYNGELAHGKYSLADIGGDPIAFHNQKKKLLRYNLIKCQSYVSRCDGTNTLGQLIHLPRFFAQFKPRHMIMVEKVINILKSKPNCMAEYQEVKSHFEDPQLKCLKRLIKTPFFHKFVLTDTRVPFRAVYPNATEREWKLPKKEAERTLNVLQLRDPNVESSQFYSKSTDNDRDDEEDGGFLDESHAVRDLPLLYQLYRHIELSKEVGVSETEASAYLGQSKLNGRALIKNLLRCSAIEFYTTSQKRQTVRRYILPKFNKKHKKTITEIIYGPQTDVEDSENQKDASETIDLSQSEMSANEVSQSEMSGTEMPESNVQHERIEVNSGDDRTDIEAESVEVVVEDAVLDQEDQFTYFEDDQFQSEKESHKSQISGDIIIKLTEVNEADGHFPKKIQLNEKRLTEKTKERLKFLQQEIQSKFLFDDPSKLLNALKRDEESRGLTDTICRKTFFRLLTYLRKVGLIRLWRIEFQYHSKHRSLLYISNKDVDSNFSLMQSCIDQAKSRFQLNIYEEETRKEAKKVRTPVTTTPLEENVDTKVEPAQKLTISTSPLMNYGHTPKFIRLRTLHEFMFYLARQHNSYDHLNQEDVVIRLAENSPLSFEDVSEMPMVYCAEIGWKMFVPPLLKHNGFDSGWCLLSDCIFRMPLSIFVKVVNIVYEIKGLNEFISHPIKKHFLVKDIPVQLQQMLFARRKYIAGMNELVRRLICIGLLQPGPHRAQKDQAFYYVNRNARLIDTSSSQPGTYYITEQEYPDLLYKFESLEDVYTYWDDMHRICMSTKLNRKPVQGSDHTPADKTLPQKFAAHLKAIQPRQAAERDKRILPGDHRGAAGLDSYFFAHLERNWAFNPAKFRPGGKIKVKSETKTSGLTYNRLVQITRDVNLKKHDRRLTAIPLYKLKSAAIRRRVPVIRKKTMVAKKKRSSSKYDDIDRMALQHMNKLRVDWNAQEDNFLLLCKVAQMYLNPNNRLVLPGQIVRDLIHWHCKSLNKTTYACRRRILYIIKKLPNSDQINNSIMTCLSEIKRNKSIEKRFGENFIQNLKKVYPNEKEFNRAFKIHFIDLVHTLSCQFYNLTNSFESNTLILPRTLQEFNARYQERNDTVYDSNTIRYDEPTNVEDIKIAQIVTLIHSTVCCSMDKTSWSIQLYEIYKDFSEHSLSTAMRKVRSDQMISQNKMSNSNIHNKAQNRCLPLSSSGFHLSATYQQQMTTKISYDIFDDSYLNLKSIFRDLSIPDQSHVLNLSHSAICFFVSELIHKNCYDIKIEMPKRILLLDPSKRLPDETFDAVYARFHEIFNYIPKVGLDDSPLDELISGVSTTSEGKSASTSTNDASNIIKKLENLPTETLHFFCIVNQFGTTRPRNQIEITEDGKCPFDCIRNLDNPTENIMEQLVAKREVWYRLNMEQFEFEPLPAVVTIDEINVIAVYNFLVLKGFNATDEQRNINLEHFKQVADIVDELLLENDKDFIDEDFGAEYDLRSDVKKKLYDGAQINDKIHKFHDFLCVNTCKLSLLPKNNDCDGENSPIDLKKMNKKREEILANIVQNANWSSELRANVDFLDFMNGKGLDMNEIHVAIDVYNFIDVQLDIGARAAMLLDRYEDKVFLQCILDYLNEGKFVMKTGVCEVTYVHHKHIKPWVVNTYHLKRLDRESLEPTTKSILQVSDESSSSSPGKRKAKDEIESCDEGIKRTKVEESLAGEEMETEPVAEECEVSSVYMVQPNEDAPSTSQTKQKPLSKLDQRLADASIEHGTEIDANFMPQSKKTFPLKMAPWIRVNGSVNRRVLDKYAGTILLHCIEHVGLTLFSLCTRFHYLLPIHVHEIVQYLEEFGCLTKTAIVKRKPTTLFSTYESVSLEPATDLDDFKDIVIEPTIDAVSKMSIFIGNKKYKDDFI